MTTHGPRLVRTLVATAVLVAAIVSVSDGVVEARNGFHPLDAPRRILDTRDGQRTFDGRSEGGGPLSAGSVHELQVTDRLGIPDDASGVVLNVAAVRAAARGFVTAFPCGASRPTAANINFAAGRNIPNLVIAAPGPDGKVCLYASAQVHLVADVSGYFGRDGFLPLVAPRRLADTRPGESTADGATAGGGTLDAGETLTVPVTGRVGLPDNANAVVLNVAAINARDAGYLTVFPCDQAGHTAANLNFSAGQTIANAVIAAPDAAGTVCVFTSAAVDIAVDVSGHLPLSVYTPLFAPQRVLDTRPGEVTIDSEQQGEGPVKAGGTIRLRLGDRVGIPEPASAVVLNVAVVKPAADGYSTVYPRGVERPLAANLNYDAGDVIPNAVVTRLGANGEICLTSVAEAHFVVDVQGFLTGPPPATADQPCDGGTATPDPLDDLDCDAAPPDTPPVPVGLTTRSDVATGEGDGFEVRTRGIWAVWWDADFDHEADTGPLFDLLDGTRCNATTQLGWADPPNLAAGRHVNVYIHHNEDDDFPDGWANGVGTNSEGLPFMTLPAPLHLDTNNVRHEGSHIFQYAANSPGFQYSGDSGWYTEATASWYGLTYDSARVDAFLGARALDLVPHLALWHGFDNAAPGDPIIWTYEVRQYAMDAYLLYLSERAGVPGSVISEGFYLSTSANPQQYLFEVGGRDLMREHFADWAAANTNELEYITRDQFARATVEFDDYGDMAYAAPFVAELTDAGSDGWQRPPLELRPRGWAYNVVRIDNTADTTYSLTVEGDETGSEGARSHFVSRVMAVGSEGARVVDLELTDGRSGAIDFSVSADESEIFLIVASVPEHFTGNQTYGYRYRIDRP